MQPRYTTIDSAPITQHTSADIQSRQISCTNNYSIHHRAYPGQEGSEYPADSFRPSHTHRYDHQPEVVTTVQPILFDYESTNKADPTALEEAIASGRVYAQPNASYVPGHVVAQANIATIYNSSIIPTFESDLEIIRPEGETEYHQQMVLKKESISQPADLKTLPVLYRPRKNYCC